MAIYKRGKVWYVDFYYRGRRIRKSLGVVSKRLAEQIEADLKAKIAKGEFLGVFEEKPVLFEDAVKIYLGYSKTHKSPSTYDREISRFRIILPHFQGKYLHEIIPKDIEAYISKRKEKVKPATINRELTVLKAMFNKFIEWGDIKENPVKSVKLLKEPPGRVRYLTSDELSRFWEALKESPPHFQALVKIAFYTGMRKSEILSLKWKNIDWKNRTIVVIETKNNERRVIPMNDEVYKVLLGLARHIRSEYIFVNPETGKPYVCFKRAWRTLLKRAKIKDFRFHDLRHNFASYLVMSGTDIRAVQELLGHKTLRMTQRYSHLAPGHLRSAVENLQIIVTNWSQKGENKKLGTRETLIFQMEMGGLEPPTPGLQSRCSPS